MDIRFVNIITIARAKFKNKYYVLVPKFILSK